jgi:hypothetical protein
MDYETTRAVLAAFEREGLVYAIFGAVALNLHGLETERVDFDGIDVTVVTPRMLHRMKRAAVRPQDRADASRLADRFGFEED